MNRTLVTDKLVVASHNHGKIIEIKDLVEPFGIKTVSSHELNLLEPEETGLTYRDNAELKAIYSARKSLLPALADDSGLSVDILDGDPGIYSARWAGENKDFSIAIQRVKEAILEKGKSLEKQKAKFICALSLCWPDGHCETFQGEVLGKLTFPPRGKKGFGYDPIFVPDGFEITFGEMDPNKKHSMSHRSHAFRQLIDNCFERKTFKF